MMYFPRPFRVTSSALTKSAKGQTCTLRLSPDICDGGGATTVLAHLDGHSAGAKGDDSHAVYACRACHDTLDGRAFHAFADCYPALILERCLRGLSETHHLMIEAGLITVKGWSNQ